MAVSQNLDTVEKARLQVVKTVSLPTATLAAILLLVLSAALQADLKQQEAGEPVAGSGHAGKILVPGRAGRVLEFPAKRVALLAWLTSEDMTGGTQSANDIWGFISPAGREYAIVGLRGGTAFVEITDPVNPEVVDFISGANSFWRDIAVYKQYAYVVNETSGGMQVIDLRRIDKGKVRAVKDFTAGGLRTSHNISINEESGFAYLSGSNLGNGGLVAIDLSDPAKPRLEDSFWPFAYVHDAQIVTYHKGPFAGREIAFAFAGEDGLQIIDVTRKSNMFVRAELWYPGLTYCHSGWLGRKSRYVYVNDELDERDNEAVTKMTTYLVDVRNLDSPRVVRPYRSKLSTIDHNSMVRRKRLFQANYESGFRVLNVKRAKRPKEIGYFDTFPEGDETAFSGAWGVFSDFPSGVVIVSDIRRGLFVLMPVAK